MSRLSCFCLAAALAALGGCNGTPVDPPSGHSHSLATPSCGPADGQVIAIYLAASPIELLPPPVPFVQVHVPVSFAELQDGGVWRVSELVSDGNAWLYESAEMPILANRGQVGITGVSTSLITGYVDLQFSNGSRIRGSFNAQWQPRQLLCG